MKMAIDHLLAKPPANGIDTMMRTKIEAELTLIAPAIGPSVKTAFCSMLGLDLAGDATEQALAAPQQRALDLVVSYVAIILLLPLLLLTVLALKLDSRGPALFRQTRVGRDGSQFTLYKFRSMHIDAEECRAALLETSDRDGICFKSRNDPRITRVGRFIRRFSIDELPQILNVLHGDMSIVGPRPALPSEVAAYPAHAFGRLAVNPGITGLWQVSGRAEVSFDRMIDMDIEYARNRTLSIDVALILSTFRAVLSGRGAY